MHDLPRVEVCESKYDLLKEVASNAFLQFPASAHVVKQVTTRADFHEEQVVVIGLDVLKHLH